jgi:predicted  nucleic acid-binding Zn-ribbon protein
MLSAILHGQQEIRSLIMALTQNEQQAINQLSSAVETLASDLDSVLQAAQTTKDDLQNQIDALKSRGQVDATTIAALQNAADALEQDVVSALTPITQRVSDIDSGLKAPSTDDSPLSVS